MIASRKRQHHPRDGAGAQYKREVLFSSRGPSVLEPVHDLSKESAGYIASRPGKPGREAQSGDPGCGTRRFRPWTPAITLDRRARHRLSELRATNDWTGWQVREQIRPQEARLGPISNSASWTKGIPGLSNLMLLLPTDARGVRARRVLSTLMVAERQRFVSLQRWARQA